MHKRIALLLLLAAAAAADAQQLGREMRLAPAPLGAARAEDVLSALVPSGTGWVTFFQRGRSIRAMGIDANGQPDYRWRQVLADVEAYSFTAARTDRGLLALWRRDSQLLVAPLGPDGVPTQRERVVIPYGFSGPLICGPSRCLIPYWQGFATDGVLIDATGKEVGQVDGLPGWVLAAAADPDGFLLVMTDGKHTTRAVRLDRDGRRMSETTISEADLWYAAADFDGEQYTIVTASPWEGPVRATALSLDGEIVGSGIVYTPGPAAHYQALGIAWSGTQHLVTIVDDESGIQVPTDSLAPSQLFAIRMARDLVSSDARAPIALSPETFASFSPFTAANGGSFFTAWTASNGNNGAIGRGTRIGPNGVAFARSVLTLRPLDQEPVALTVGADGPVAVWTESDGLANRTTIRAGAAGRGAARTVADVRYLWSAHAAAIDDDVLVTWYASAARGTGSCCIGAAAAVTASDIIPVPTDGLLADLRVAAGRSRWMIAGYSLEGVSALLVDRDGKRVTPEPIAIARMKDSRSYDVASDGDTFLIVSTSYPEAGVTATLLDAEGRILHTARIAQAGMISTIAWNGSEYAVALVGEGGFLFVRVGPDGEARGRPAFYPWSAPWAQIPSLAPFGNGWLMALRSARGRSLVHFSADFTELAVLSGLDFAAVAAGADGRTYALESEKYEPAPYPTSLRAVVREVLPTLPRSAP